MFIKSDIVQFNIDECIAHLEKKYGAKFEFSRLYSPDQPGRTSLRIFVKTDRYPGKEIFVIQEEDEGSLLVHDNLADIRFEDETREFITKIASDVFGECRVIYDVNNSCFLADDLNDDTTFEEYIATGSYHITASVVLPPDHGISQKEEEISRFMNALIEKKAAVRFSVYYTKDNEYYQSVKTNADLEIDRLKCEAICGADVREDFTAGQMIWR